MNKALSTAATCLLIVASIAVSSTSFAQSKGTISGVVRDSLYDETIISANVRVEGTSMGAATNMDGQYSISVPVGTYTLIYSYIGFEQKRYTLTVKSGETITQDVELIEKILAGTVVIGEKIEDTETAGTEKMKEADVTIAVVTKEEIEKTLASHAGAVVSRIPGITLIDSKFVIVRGLSQRYNSVKLNGLPVPSTDPTTRAFSFDIIPSGVIGSATTYKSFSADLAAEVAGAVVNITTLNNFEEPYNEISVKLGYRFNTTFETGLTDTYYGGSDAFGLGGASREWSNSVNPKVAGINTQQNAVQATSFNNTDFFGKSFSVLPDFGISAKTGKILSVGDGNELLFTGAASLSNSTKIVRSEQGRYSIFDEDFTPFEFTKSSRDTRVSRSANMNLMGNFLYELPGGKKLTFQNLYNRIGTSEVITKEGQDQSTGRDQLVENIDYMNESLYSSQLGADLPLSDRNRLKVVVGYARTAFNQPNRRAYYLQRAIGSQENYEVILPVGGAALIGTTRFMSQMQETSVSTSVDFVHLFGSETDEHKPSKIKVGVYGESRTRTFESRNIGYGQPAFDPLAPDFVGAGLGIDEVFADENFFTKQNGERGIVINEKTQTTDRYEAFNRTMAGYASYLFRASIFDFNLGARAEFNSQNITGAENQNSPYGSLNDTRDNFNILPYLNVNAKVSDKFQIRGAYASTINRPELRELAPFSYYDFFYDRNMRGNPNVQQATIQNYDIRFELYPKEKSPELISLAFFYKDFTNPIELVNLNDNDVFEFQNMQSAYSAGIEFEFKKSLDFISKSPIFSNTSFMLNTALIKSQTKLTLPNAIEVNQNRPLQGQSPYIINAGLYYADDKSGWAVNVNYNTYGKRIIVSEASSNRPPIYELPRQFLDLSVSKKLENGWKIKASATNILNAEYRLYIDGNFDEKIDIKEDIPAIDQNDPMFQRFREGQKLEISLSKRF